METRKRPGRCDGGKSAGRGRRCKRPGRGDGQKRPGRAVAIDFSLVFEINPRPLPKPQGSDFKKLPLVVVEWRAAIKEPRPPDDGPGKRWVNVGDPAV